MTSKAVVEDKQFMSLSFGCTAVLTDERNLNSRQFSTWWHWIGNVWALVSRRAGIR